MSELDVVGDMKSTKFWGRVERESERMIANWGELSRLDQSSLSRKESKGNGKELIVYGMKAVANPPVC